MKLEFPLATKILKKRLASNEKFLSGSLLDIGCGEKPFRDIFSGVTEYTGTNTRATYDAEKLASLERMTDVWLEPGQDLPFGDCAFDSVACFQVLSVVEKPEKLLSEALRVLKKDGVFMISTDFIYPKWHPSLDLRRFSDSYFHKIANDLDAEVVRVESCGGVLSSVFVIIQRRLRDVSFRSEGSFSAVKAFVKLVLVVLSKPLVWLLGRAIFQLEINESKSLAFAPAILVILRKR